MPRLKHGSMMESMMLEALSGVLGGGGNDADEEEGVTKIRSASAGAEWIWATSVWVAVVVGAALRGCGGLVAAAGGPNGSSAAARSCVGSLWDWVTAARGVCGAAAVGCPGCGSR